MIRSILRRLLCRHTTAVAYLALFAALGGSAYAAVTVTGKDIKDGTVTGRDVKNSSISSADVKNRSLLRNDFKSGQLPSGPRGAQGPQGAQGDEGPEGPQGPAGAAANQIQRVTGPGVSVPTTPNTVADASATCPAGEVATGGGVTQEFADQGIYVVRSFASNATTWIVTVKRNSGTLVDVVRAQVLCVPGSAALALGASATRSR